MGQHYLPRYYLRGFAPSFGDRVWVYDRRDARKFRTGVKSIANETKLYPDELEKRLAEEVEGPANKVLDKIRARSPVNDDDRETLARYLVALWKRVPKSQKRLVSHLPKASAEVEAGIHAGIDRLTLERPDLKELGERRKAEVSAIVKRYEDTPPPEVWHYGINPDTALRVTRVLTAMVWRFWFAEAEGAFLTSDDPVFFFEGIGLNKPESELSFPVSSKVMLWLTWRVDMPQGYLSPSNALVKEFNRRTVQNSDRFVIAHSDESWILPLVLKPAIRLNRIL